MYIVAQIIGGAISVYSWMLVIYILMSWIPNLQNSSFGLLMARVCEPFLAPFRRIIPPIGGMIDISPIIAFFVLRLASRGVTQLAYYFG